MMSAKLKLLKAVSKSLDFKDVRVQDTGEYSHMRLKQYINAYIDDEAIIDKSERLYDQDSEELFEEAKQESDEIKVLEEEVFEIESAEIDS